jgi:hypothetical protein
LVQLDIPAILVVLEVPALLVPLLQLAELEGGVVLAVLVLKRVAVEKAALEEPVVAVAVALGQQPLAELVALVMVLELVSGTLVEQLESVALAAV